MVTPQILLSKASHARAGVFWVGGRVTLTATDLYFAPDAANRQVHPDTDRRLPLTSVTGVVVQTGVLTDVVTVRSTDGDLEFRCFAAEQAAAAIRAAADQTG